jgi:phage gp46-like protein
MRDIALVFEARSGEFDLALAGEGEDRDILGDDGLLSAVIISLFSDRRAREDDPLPDERVGLPTDRRGWWGDHVLEEDARDGLGSRLWLLAREKDLPVVVARALEYARESLAWLVAAGLAQRVEVSAERIGPGYLGIGVAAVPPGGTEMGREWRFGYDYSSAPVKISIPGGV